jgi:hypothetical protein
VSFGIETNRAAKILTRVEAERAAARSDLWPYSAIGSNKKSPRFASQAL